MSRSLAAGGKPRFSYEIGNIVYWSPGPDIAIFYDHDGQSAKSTRRPMLSRSTTAWSTSLSRPPTETQPETTEIVNQGEEGGRSWPRRPRRRPG
ncbi:hypothetical protein ACFW93_34475 [Streptomyces canus]|uniref:hypothetical protein n=1 Tax=Streptomyces canus TaxID=58343 RepID=UPI0036CEF796